MPGHLEVEAFIQQSINADLDNWAMRFGPRLILALSGGGDSMALALFCARWMKPLNGSVHAVCIDHGLRDGSDQEAQQTVRWAKALGLSAEVIALNLERGQTRLQERAREARHLALVAAAKTHNARVILLAHNQDDQHETLALRLGSQTGLDGLAGISKLSPSPFYQDDWPCLLGRPLLEVSRDSLRDILKKTGQDWHEDPSNTNRAFARIRTRSRLAELKQASVDISAFSRIAAYAAALRQASDVATCSRLIAANLKIENARISLSAQVLCSAALHIQERTIAWLAFAVGGGERQPDAVKISRLCYAISQSEFRGATLAGAMFTRRGDRLIVAHAKPRRNQKPAAARKTRDVYLRLQAISRNLDQFVTHLG